MITIEQILEAVKNDNGLAVKILENVPQLPGGAEYLKKANDVYFQENIGTKVSEIYNNIDEDVFTITGKRKKAEQKTYDFVKEIIGDLKKEAENNGSGTEEVKTLKDKIKTLEEQVKNGESSAHWKQSYEDVIQQLKTQKEDYEGKMLNMQNDILKGRVLADVKGAMSLLKFNSQLPESVIKAMVSQHEEQLIKNAQIIDNNLVYFDEQGKPLRDLSFNNATASFLLKERLKDILEVEGSSGGEAPKGKGEVIKTGTGDNATAKLVLDKSAFSSKVKFYELAEKTLLEQGISRGTKEFTSMIDEAYKEYGVAELERV